MNEKILRENRRLRKKIRKCIVFIILLLLVILLSFSAYLYFKGDEKVDTPQNNVDKNKENDNKPNTKDPIIDEPNPNTPTDDPIIEALKKETYYIPDNLNRYLSYIEKYPDKSMTEIIRSINSNIDYEFYTHVNPSNLEDKYLIIVNKYYNVSENYVPELVSMEGTYTYVSSAKMEPVAYEHFKEMVDAAAKEGIKLYNVSSYRSYYTQKNLYANYVSGDGKNAADRYSARPGYSEHQTGLATDINTASSSAHFENTKEYKWLISNSYKYGFILRYPQDKEYLTGYKFEPWHYRYCGLEAATYIHEHNILFEEYYEYFVNNKN